MDRRIHAQMIPDRHFEVIAFFNVNQGTWVLVVYKIDWTTDAISTAGQLPRSAIGGREITYQGLQRRCER